MHGQILRSNRHVHLGRHYGRPLRPAQFSPGNQAEKAIRQFRPAMHKTLISETLEDTPGSLWILELSSITKFPAAVTHVFFIGAAYSAVSRVEK